MAPWCEELTHWKRPWCWERLKAGGEGGDIEWNDCMASPHRINGHEFEQSPGDSEGEGSLVCCSSCGHRVGHDLAIEQQQQRLQID